MWRRHFACRLGTPAETKHCVRTSADAATRVFAPRGPEDLGVVSTLRFWHLAETPTNLPLSSRAPPLAELCARLSHNEGMVTLETVRTEKRDQVLHLDRKSVV